MPTYIFNDGTLIAAPAAPSPDIYSTIYGFTNRQLIEVLYAEKGIINIIDDVDDITVDVNGFTDADNVIRRFIKDAEQTVFIRLSNFFAAIDMVDHPWVCSRTTWIAAHYISKRRGNEHYFEDLYTEALRELDAMATGELTPPIDIPLRNHTYPAMTNYTIDERFAVSKIRVRPTISVGGPYPGQDTTFGYFWGWL